MTHQGGKAPLSSTGRFRSPVMTLLKTIDALTRLDGWLGAGCLTALTALMIAGMATRMLSGILTWLPPDVPIAWEYGSYLMAATFTFGAAMTLRSGEHIRVRLILSRVDGSVRQAMEIAASIVAFCFSGYFTWALLHFTVTSYLLDERSIASNTPLWIPKAVVTFGMVLLALQFLARAVRVCMNLPLDIAAFETRSESKAATLLSN